METETVYRLRATTDSNAYGGTDDDWTDPDRLAITTVAPPEPRQSSEPLEDARDSVIRGWVLYLPTGSDVLATDRMEVRGVAYPVDGQPGEWGMGLVVQTVRTEG